MKINKIIALLLICILLSCVSLCACSLQGIIDKIIPTTAAEPKKEPLKIIETTMTDKNGKEFIISHSDNFTQDDLDFVAMWHGERLGGNFQKDISKEAFLDGALYMTRILGDSLFTAHFENPYVISAYQKPNLDEYEKDASGFYYFDVSRYVWCKFENPTDTPDSFEGMEQTDRAYVLYDCTVKEDIVSGTSYNKACKYYYEYCGEQSLIYTAEDMLIYYFSKYELVGDSKFVPHANCAIEIYFDENGKEHIYFKHEEYTNNASLIENYSKDLFRDYYDILSPYFEVLEEKTLDDKVVSYAGVELDTLVDVITSSQKVEAEIDYAELYGIKSIWMTHNRAYTYLILVEKDKINTFLSRYYGLLDVDYVNTSTDIKDLPYDAGEIIIDFYNKPSISLLFDLDGAIYAHDSEGETFVLYSTLPGHYSYYELAQYIIKSRGK